MPPKSNPYGIKFWVLSDVNTKYTWNLEVYISKTYLSRADINSEKIIQNYHKISKDDSSERSGKAKSI